MLTQVGALEEGTKARASSPALATRKILAPDLAPKTLAAPFFHDTNATSYPFSHSFSTIANMGFTDFVSDAGLTLLNNWVKTRSYIVG